MRRKIFNLFFGIGILLLTINFIGIFIIPLKNPKIYTHKTGFKNDITLTTKEVLAIINKQTENKEEYIKNVTYAINKGILHYCDKEYQKVYHSEIPIQENYVLYIFHRLMNYGNGNYLYEFCDYKKTIQRGVGCCSQVSIALADILNKQNIYTDIITYPEHVITEVFISENKSWVLDPDYGVIIEHSLEEVTNHPHLIERYYKKQHYTNQTITNLKNIFRNKQNRKIYSEKNNTSLCALNHRSLIEKLSYLLKWLIPTILILPYLITLLKQKYARGKK